MCCVIYCPKSIIVRDGLKIAFMNTRLRQIIDYKTNGKKKVFAELIGWKPQYLGKLLHGDDFGLKPVIALLKALPEINARWLLLGEGEMLTPSGAATIRQGVFAHIEQVLNIERYLPYMTPKELSVTEASLLKGATPVFDRERIDEWERRIAEREGLIREKFEQAQQKQEGKSCRQPIANE